MPLSLFCDLVDGWILGRLSGHDSPEMKALLARYERDTADGPPIIQTDRPRPDQAGGMREQEAT